MELESTSGQAGSEPSVNGLVMVGEPAELPLSLGPEMKLSKHLGDCRKVVVSSSIPGAGLSVGD